MTKAIAKELHLSGEIKRALKTHGESFTPDAVQHLTDETQNLIGDLEGEITEKQKVVRDITTEDEDRESAKRDLLALQGQLDMFSDALPRLEELHRLVTVRVRDEQQKRDYTALQNEGAELHTLMREFMQACPGFARLLARTARYHDAIRRFNQPPQAGHQFINPKDRLESKYEPLPHIAPDAFVRQSVICDMTGAVLFSGATSKASHPAPMAANPVDTVKHASEIEQVKQAREMQSHAQNRLKAFAVTAQAQGVTIETVASWQNMTDVDLKRVQEQADGKFLAEAQRELKKAIGAEQPPAKKEGPSGGH